jgi:hypothetical protein
MSSRGLRSVWLAALLSGAVGAQAQEQGTQPWERASLSIGGFVSTTNSELQLNSDTLGAGAVVDLENGLDLDSSYTSYRIDGFYRFGSTRRHQIEAHYYRSNRDGERLLDQTYQIGDTVFPAGSGVTTDMDVWFLNVNYAYAFLQDDRVRLAAAVGLHTTGISFKISGTGIGVEEEDVTAPLPVIGLRGDVALTQRWRLWAAADVFYLEYDAFKGALLDTGIGVEYLPFKNLGFGLGLNAVRYRLEADGGEDLADINGEVRYDFAGALLYLKFFF